MLMPDGIALLDKCLDRMQHTLHLLQKEALSTGLDLCAPKASSFKGYDRCFISDRMWQDSN